MTPWIVLAATWIVGHLLTVAWVVSGFNKLTVDVPGVEPAGRSMRLAYEFLVLMIFPFPLNLMRWLKLRRMDPRDM
jgi:hypothetical protein